MSVQHERAFVGRLLTSAKTMLETSLDDRHFADPLCRLVFQTAGQCLQDGIEPTIVTVCDPSRRVLNNREGEVAELTTEAHVGRIDWIEAQLVTAYESRVLQQLGRTLLDLADDPAAAIAAVDESMEALATADTTNRVWSARELVRPTIETIEERYHAKGELPGVPSGIRELDAMSNGFQDGMFYVIAARPSVGKSALLKHLATFVSTNGSNSPYVPAGVFSAESSRHEFMVRAFADFASIDSMRLSNGMIGPSDFGRLTQAGEKLYESKLYIYDEPNMGIARLTSLARLMKRKHGIRILFVDYVQIIDAAANDRTRTEQVSLVSRALKKLARSLEIPVVAVAQAGRESEKEHRWPRQSDVQHASQIEQDVDGLMFIHPENERDGRLKQLWLVVLKMRDGKTGSIPIHFEKRFLRFTDRAPERWDDNVRGQGVNAS